jgi:hypothetical protein
MSDFCANFDDATAAEFREAWARGWMEGAREAAARKAEPEPEPDPDVATFEIVSGRYDDEAAARRRSR